MVIPFVVFITVFVTMLLAYVATAGLRNRSAAAKIEDRLSGSFVAPPISDLTGPAIIRDDETAGRRQSWLETSFARLLKQIVRTPLARQSTKVTLRSSLVAGCAVGLLASLFLSADLRPFTFVFATAAAAIPVLRLKRAAKKRRDMFESQLPDALEFIARSMKAGHGFSSSLEMLSVESEEPVKSEFRQVFEEQNLGMPLDAALERLCERTALIDVRYFVSAVLLQRTTGGNLAEILNSVAGTIRERYKFQGKIRAVSAHGRITAKVLAGIPGVVAVVLFMVNPHYAEFFLRTTTGHQMLAACLGLQIVGFLVIQKIVQIDI